MAVGLDALFVEVHEAPERALSDRAIAPPRLGRLGSWCESAAGPGRLLIIEKSGCGGIAWREAADD